MNLFSRITSVLVLLLLAACGGGGSDTGTSPFDKNPTGPGTSKPTAADLVFVLSAGSVANTGKETVVATATAIDGNRNSVAGVPITVSVNSDGVVTPSGTVTNASGQLNATIGIGSNKANRTITVTATSGAIAKSIDLLVQDTGGSSSGTASDLLLTLSSATISSSGASPVTATATALDAKRNILPGVVVSLSVDQGATVTPSGTTTNTAGVVTALIGTGGDSTLRTIKITATAPGLAPKTINLNVVSAPATTNPIASDLSLALSANTLLNGGTSTILATVTAVDINRNALLGIPVTITVNNNAVATVSASSTNSNGVVTAAVGIGSDRSNRTITVTASSGSITKSASFLVVGAALSASFSPSVTTSSIGNKIEYRLVDFNSSAMAGQAITVTRENNPAVAGVTDSNGKFLYSYDAPAAATTLSIVATAAGETRTQSVVVNPPGTSVPQAVAVPQSASLTPTPSVVPVNALGSTSNQTELRALFLGANNQPINNIRAYFSVDPANSSDGVASPLGGALFAYSDGTGVARGTFTPGQRSSPTNGVTVRACWAVTDFDTTRSCPSAGSGTQPDIYLATATLTIASEALSVNIRTNNLVKTGAAGLTYIKEFVVMVVDAAGQAKPDVLITPSVDLTAYHKGYFAWTGTFWSQFPQLADTENYSWNPATSAWEKGSSTSQPQCPNEDINRNGVREAPVYVSGAAAPALAARQEDLNWNGELDPRKSDVAVKMVGSPRTDANGLAIVQIEYGQNVAAWVDYIITVTASGVAGTEARARYAGLYYGIGNLPYPANAVTAEAVAPAFAVSPYGKGFPGSLIPPTRIGVCTDTN